MNDGRRESVCDLGCRGLVFRFVVYDIPTANYTPTPVC